MVTTLTTLVLVRPTASSATWSSASRRQWHAYSCISLTYTFRQSLPAVSDVTGANFDEFTKADKIVAIAFLSSPTGAPGPEFSVTANRHRDDFLFGATTDPAVIEAAGVTPPAIVLYRSFDEPQTEFPYPLGSAKAKDIEDWIKALSIPVLDEVNTENFQVYAQSGKPLAYLFLDPSDSQHEEQIAEIRPVASRWKDSLNFVWIDGIKFGDHARALNLNEPKWPSFVIQDLRKQLKYPYDQESEVKADAVNEMVMQFLDGKLEPQLKSQPIPATQDESVFNLVGKQFDEVIFDEDKDIFVEFYASWYVSSRFRAFPSTITRFVGAVTASALSLHGTPLVTTMRRLRIVSPCKIMIFV